MLYPELVELENEMRQCRKLAQDDPRNLCCGITQWECHNGCDIGLLRPNPNEINENVEILVIGINPRYTKRKGSTEGFDKKKNNGKTFEAYQRSILKDVIEIVKDNGIIAYTELVPCGTPNGSDVFSIIDNCRVKHFDKMIDILRPKLIVAIGSYASENLYWHNTNKGQNGENWDGIQKRHASYERAQFGNHECNIAFVLQPSSYGLTNEKKELAAQALYNAYQNAL